MHKDCIDATFYEEHHIEMMCYVYYLFLSMDFSSVSANYSVDHNLDDCWCADKRYHESINHILKCRLMPYP